MSWYEARAYGDWLHDRLKTLAVERVSAGDRDPFWIGLADGSLKAGLPSEASGSVPPEGRMVAPYPWGEQPDPDCANYDETGIGATSTVGAFPRGATPAGCEDMAGNCWEWTRSLWGRDWSKSDSVNPKTPATGARI